jgi:hypothetical protein
LPEFYASQLAAEGIRSTNAEPSIGFIPAANAIKVFLGLGLPWTIATIKKNSDSGDVFCLGEKNSGELSFVAMLLACISIFVFLLLLIRRTTNSGELGGATCSRALSSCFLVLLWFAFVIIVSMNCFDYLNINAVFTPVGCGQELSDFPAQMVTPFTTDGPEYIQINWALQENDDASNGRALAADRGLAELAGGNLAGIGEVDAVEV